MDDTLVLFEQMCSEILYIVANTSVWKPENPIPAGDLKISFTNWPKDDCTSCMKAHFLATTLGSPAQACWVPERNIVFEKALHLEVTFAYVAKMNTVKRFINDNKTNEAAVYMYNLWQ